MGLNIIAYEITGEAEYEDWGFQKHKYKVVQGYDGFDSCRYSGDRDFVTTDALDWEEIPDSDYSMETRFYNRPKDIDKAREWIKANVYEGNQSRLLKLMDDMEANPNLVIYNSW
jgi:hypothetical protein